METSSLLDHIYCNNSSNNIISGLIFYDKGDRNPVFVIIPKNKVSPASRPRDIRTPGSTTHFGYLR